ncbi:MAG: hypothetical protein AAFP68_06125 [Pseudomonadota bacterium]
METAVKSIFDFAPKDVLRLLIGGAILGMILLVFLHVVDVRFAPPDWCRNVLGIALTGLLGLLLCLDIKCLRKRSLSVVVASMIIFTVGLATGDMVARTVDFVKAPAIPERPA